MRYQKGVTLLSLVGILTVLAIAAVVGVVAFSQQQAKLPNQVVDRQVNQMFTFASALSRCYHDYRDWRLCDANRVVTYYPSNHPTGAGYVAMDGNAVTWQVVSGAGSPEEDLDISFTMVSADTARRIQRFLPNARVSGNRVTWTLDPPTETVDHVNQIARYADNVYQRQTNATPSNNRNQVEIDLSFGQDTDSVDERQRLTNLQRVDIDQLNLAKVDDSDIQGGTLTISERLTIEEQDEALRQTNQGTADIYVQNNVLQVDTQTAALSGSAQVDGLTVQGHFINQGDWIMEQGAQLGGNVTVGESLEVDQDVTIAQNATFNGALSIMSRLQAASLSVSGQIESRGNQGFVGDDFCIQKQGESDVCLNQSHNDTQDNERQRLLNRRGYVNTVGDSGAVDNINDNQANRIANASSAEANRRRALINRQGFVTTPGDSNTGGSAPLNINANLAAINRNADRIKINEQGYVSEKGDSDVDGVTPDNINDNRAAISANRLVIDEHEDQIKIHEQGYITAPGDSNTGGSAPLNINANRAAIDRNADRIKINEQGYISEKGDSDVDGVTPDNINDNRAAIDGHREEIDNHADRIKINEQGYISRRGDSDVNGKTPDNIDDNERDSIDNQVAIDKAIADLRNCVIDTRYCIPEKPLINDPQCQGCVQSLRGPAFTATARASISGCRQGCLYRWTVSVPGLTETCDDANGSVSAGSFRDVSCTISADDLEPQENRRGTVRLFVENRVYGDNPNFTTTQTFNIDWTNTTPLEPEVSVSCDGCESRRQIEDFSSIATGSITNCPQGCTYSWSVSGGASAACPSGSISRGGSANPTCRITDTLEAQTGSSGTAVLTARNAVNTFASDSDSVRYSFFNSQQEFENCSAQTVDVPVTIDGVHPEFFHPGIQVPALQHGENYIFFQHYDPVPGCLGQDYDVRVDAACVDGNPNIRSIGTCQI